MFCPKCGNELAEGAKFCAVCGEQIVKEAAVASTLQNHTTKGAAGKKPILTGVIAVVAILAVVLIINAVRKPSDSQETGKNGTIFSKEDGFDSYEEVIDALFTAAYNKDVEAVVDCFPEEIQSDAIQLYNDYRNTTGNSNALFFMFMNMNPDNEYSYEIVGVTKLEQNEIDELQTKYGITIDEGYTVEVQSVGKFYQDDIPGLEGYVTTFPKGHPIVAKIGKSWYLVEGDDSLWDSRWCD